MAFTIKTSRRSFFSSLGVHLPWILGLKGARFSRPANQATVVSTWDSGVIANQAAWKVLLKGGHAIDAVEAAGRAIEDVVSCCVGLGGNPDRDGFVTLDACIMDEKANIGSVAFLQRIKHPITVARQVMEKTPHVMLVGAGAQKFALEMGHDLQSADLSESAARQYRKWLEKSTFQPQINIERNTEKKGKGPFAPNMMPSGSFNHDTMGTVALDNAGNLCGMCTTSGMAFKMHGRVGDSPIIGAGLFVDNEIGAVTCSGQGEEVIRVAGSHLVVEFMRNGLSPKNACAKAVERIVSRDANRAKKFQVGFIALAKDGRIGAYAIQPGFNYTVTHADEQEVVLDAESYFG